ncbi:ABC transporter ATP-binding protein [Spiroplasma chrysopicola]|uniref:ABC-2 type transport system ATP-binding protein n=1 Tax=Spiroplasma chrysopicola DF-1 TaxID=1276227 RepID=R4U1R0_9MOLU|nr:ABC transporter ATP-binding protein [Spiroplasma chrysopicola]AGM25257.1 ABC-2 type transport system ATP-binding protein [Spiroplasma chrysopicola DF-1]
MKFEIKNYSKLFKNGAGINELSMEFNSGDIVGLIGDNGAGKSTFIKCIFREYEKDTGEIYLDGENMQIKDLRKFSLFPDQSIYPSGISIYDFMYYTASLSGIKNKEIKEIVLKALQAVNLLEYKNKTFKNLSAGMQKRALLANALITKPKVLFLDEPTANLDVKTRVQFLDLLKSLAEQGMAIIITTHLIDELAQIINRLVIIEKGEKVFEDVINKTTDIRKIYQDVTISSSEKINLSVFTSN